MAFRVMNQVEEESDVMQEFEILWVYCDGDIVKEFEFWWLG